MTEPTIRVEGTDVRTVRMTPELMEALFEAAAGRGHRIAWGEPDAAGFWSPTVTFNARLDPFPADPTDPETHEGEPA